MNRIKRSSVFALALLSAAIGTVARAQCPPPPPGEDPIVPQRTMVRVAPYASIDHILALLHTQFPTWTVTVGDAIEPVDTYLLDTPPDAECAIADYLDNLRNRDPNTVVDPTLPVVWAEADYEGQASEGKTGTIYINLPGPSAPTYYEEQYAGGTLGLLSAFQSTTGRGTAVAVIDTGIDPNHPVLRNRLIPGYNFVTDSPDTRDVGNGINDDPHHDALVDEMVGHGTFVAGLIAYSAPDARILPVVALNSDGVASAFDLGKATQYAIDRGVEVINLSLGSTYDSEIMEDAIRRARRKGIVVVGAIGNLNHAFPPEFPAMREDVLGVAATSDADRKASFSNYHTCSAAERLCVELSAPGDSQPMPGGPADYDADRSIFSTTPGGEYGVWEGTSISCAFVSGAAALVRSQHPEWPADISTAVAVGNLLRSTGVNIDSLNPGYAGQLGRRLNTGAAVAAGPPAPLAGDLNADGQVALDDIAALLSDWGRVHTSADLNADGIVGLEDLSIQLSNFGL